MAGRLAAGLRNLQTAAMDEISTAVFKATTDDLFEPKEKHVVAVARWSCEPELQEQVASALAKRVSTCGARPVTTAKTLFLLHRVATTGEPEAVLGPSVAELRSLVERRSLPAAELAYAPYIVGLCEWDDCNLFRRPDAPACWRGMPLPAVLEGLRPLQALAEQALELALDASEVTTPAVAALRLAVAEDAFAMFLCETAGAAVLQDGLLAAPLALVNLRPGGLLEALRASNRHAEDALMLQEALGSWRGGSGRLDAVLLASSSHAYQAPLTSVFQRALLTPQDGFVRPCPDCSPAAPTPSARCAHALQAPARWQTCPTSTLSSRRGCRGAAPARGWRSRRPPPPLPPPLQ
mmetsp:Transcript_6214/g.20754  ORF Transcript_6214/g.20754 Transcript_6214/m.20754 type:complete len:351 (-) Transcript_6214:740-1792(-)